MSLLSVEQLNAGYGKLQILHDLSLSVDAGQFVGIFGPNGSGKSTLIKSIFGLTRIFSGTIKLETVNKVKPDPGLAPLSPTPNPSPVKREGLVQPSVAEPLFP